MFLQSITITGLGEYCGESQPTLILYSTLLCSGGDITFTVTDFTQESTLSLYKEGVSDPLQISDGAVTGTSYTFPEPVSISTNDRDAVYSNLKTAVEKDAALKTKAQKDIEFAKFADDETFLAIVK